MHASDLEKTLCRIIHVSRLTFATSSDDLDFKINKAVAVVCQTTNHGCYRNPNPYYLRITPVGTVNVSIADGRSFFIRKLPVWIGIDINFI